MLLDDKEWSPGVPRCAHTCPTGAMQFYTLEPAEFEKIAAAEGLSAYRPELGTKPHVLYKNLYKFTKNFITAGVLVDGDCFENAEVTLLCREGVAGRQRTNFFGEFKFDGLDNGQYTVEIDAAGKRTACEVRIDDEVQESGIYQSISGHQGAVTGNR